MFQKDKVTQSMIDAVNQVLGEAKVEPAKPDPEAIARKKKLDALRDKQDAEKAEKGHSPSATRKVAGHAYGGAKQKDDEMDEEVKLDEAEMDESGLRMAAHAAHKAGQSHFEFKGKKYPVKVTEDGKVDCDYAKVKDIARKEVKGHEKSMHKEELSFAKKLKSMLEAKGPLAGAPDVFTDNNLGEEEMSDAQMKKREKIVMSMKDKTAQFKAKYGKNWKNVMYATATKQAMKEDADITKPNTENKGETKERQKITTNPGPVDIKTDDKLGKPTPQAYFTSKELEQVTQEEVMGELKHLRHKEKGEHKKRVSDFKKHHDKHQVDDGCDHYQEDIEFDLIDEGKDDGDYTHVAHYEDNDGNWMAKLLIDAEHDGHAIETANKAMGKGPFAGLRVRKIERVMKVHDGRMQEEVEQLDELDPKTLASYAKKASHDARIKQTVARDFLAKSNTARSPRKKETWSSLSKKYQSGAWKREKGHDLAIDKLAKEDVEYIDEGKMKDIYTSMMMHADKKGYKSHKEFTPADYTAVGKEHGISGKDLAVIAGHKTASQVAKEETEVEINEGKMKDIYTSMMNHADKKGYKSHKEFTSADYNAVGKEHGISGKDLAVIAGHKTASQVAKEEAEGSWQKESPWKKSPGTVTDKSGAKHTPMSRVKDIAKQALKKVKQETMMGKISN